MFTTILPETVGLSQPQPAPRPGAWRRLHDALYLVRSANERTPHAVYTVNIETGSCTCPAFTFGRRRDAVYTCRHLTAVRHGMDETLRRAALAVWPLPVLAPTRPGNILVFPPPCGLLRHTENSMGLYGQAWLCQDDGGAGYEINQWDALLGGERDKERHGGHRPVGPCPVCGRPFPIFKGDDKCVACCLVPPSDPAAMRKLRRLGVKDVV